MHIHLFPRPSADTGIGLHWCAGRSQLPIQQVRAFWIPELRALGAAWIKLNDHRECLPLVEELLAAGIQPIVRIYRPAPNPGPLNDEELAAVGGLVRAGVRYIEISHRPDLPAQWRNGVLPPDAQALVARHLAQDLAEVLARGALPALPAVDPASGWDLITELIRLGKRDVLQGPIWQAIHNPGHNRPPDYPADAVHREGAPLTQSYYLALADEEWEGDAWQGRSLAEVNRLRRRTFASQQTREESGGFFNFAPLHARHRELLGRAIPILSTSGGYVVGAADDSRYPALTPSLHLAYTLEACRTLMGSSTRFAPAPDYFFCASFWLLANQLLDSSRPARENDAWYSPDHPNGVLPIVPVLQAESKCPRYTPQVASAEPASSAQSGESLIAFTAAALEGKGLITGKVRGGASVDLRLVSLDSGLTLQTIARSNGDYRFVDLPAGRYSLWVEEPPGSRRGDVGLEDDQTVAVDLAVQGWGYEITEAADGPGGMLQCSVALTADMAAAPSLRLRWVGGERVLAMVRSGKERMARCSAGPLEAGVYDVQLLGIPDSSPGDLRATIPVGRTTETHIHFVHSRLPDQSNAPRASVIEGRVSNGETTQVTLQNADGRRRSVTTDPRGRFRFPGLAAGSYTVSVAGAEQNLSRTRLGVDGEHYLLVGFDLPSPVEPTPPPRAGLQGKAPGQAGRTAILTSADGLSLTRRIDDDATFCFEHLAPGQYDLVAGGVQAAGLRLNAGECLRVNFPPANPQWQVNVRSRATLRRPGLVRVQVLGRKGLSVTLRGESAGKQMRPTGSALEYGPFAVEFGPLDPGSYTVAVEGVDVTAAFTLDSTDAAVITFQRDGALSGSPHLEYQPV
ncbi:MAG: carboxypeptidase regulatory-like domain-containing protein [Chloroflexi bacterium]|nr:carboxypeptidase regulatory-like domain-containing protein [Chloroflexota bacterium]